MCLVWLTEIVLNISIVRFSCFFMHRQCCTRYASLGVHVMLLSTISVTFVSTINCGGQSVNRVLFLLYTSGSIDLEPNQLGGMDRRPRASDAEQQRALFNTREPL